MSDLVEVEYKHVPFNCRFEFNGQEYEKTNHGRGFYYKEGKMIFRNFKKSKLVKTGKEYFDQLPLTNS